jgi:hypothetical protein
MPQDGTPALVLGQSYAMGPEPPVDPVALVKEAKRVCDHLVSPLLYYRFCLKPTYRWRIQKPWSHDRLHLFILFCHHGLRRMVLQLLPQYLHLTPRRPLYTPIRPTVAAPLRSPTTTVPHTLISCTSPLPAYIPTLETYSGPRQLTIRPRLARSQAIIFTTPRTPMSTSILSRITHRIPSATNTILELHTIQARTVQARTIVTLPNQRETYPIRLKARLTRPMCEPDPHLQCTQDHLFRFLDHPHRSVSHVRRPHPMLSHIGRKRHRLNTLLGPDPRGRSRTSRHCRETLVMAQVRSTGNWCARDGAADDPCSYSPGSETASH